MIYRLEGGRPLLADHRHQMDDRIHSSHRTNERGLVQNGSLDRLEVTITEQLGGSDPVNEAPYDLGAFLQLLEQMPADEARCTGQEDHGGSVAETERKRILGERQLLQRLRSGLTYLLV